MITFEDNELEIAIITYNRAGFIKEWLDYCYKDACDRNITLSIYDSSSNNETEQVLKNYNIYPNYEIKYNKLPCETILGYKPMVPLLNSEKKYVWVSGDSRCHNFSELDMNVFRWIKQDYDYILLLADKKQKNNEYSSNDLGKFIRDCFISSTCIGFSIYKTSMFAFLKNDKVLKNEYDIKFKNNYGFGWLGYFYNVFAKGKYKAITCHAQIIDIAPKKKKQVWAKRFYECWIDNLCQIIDNIPDDYEKKDQVPKIVWDGIGLYKDQFCYLARINGDLNKNSLARYETEGLLDRVTSHKKNIEFYALAPLFLVKIKYLVFKSLGRFKHLVSKMIKV